MPFFSDFLLILHKLITITETLINAIRWVLVYQVHALAFILGHTVFLEALIFRV